MRLLPFWVRRPMEALYERRLAATLVGLPAPKHVGIMLDGNRRWARRAGHEDVREGYRVGGAKVPGFLEWCTAAGIEHVTLFMLSDDNLDRPAEQLVPLIGIIEQTVREISAEGLPWEVQVIGALDLLPGDTARTLKEAAAAASGRGGMRVDVAVGYGGGARSRTRCGRRSRPTWRSAATRPTWSRSSRSTTSAAISTPAPGTTRSTW